jgi:hypothetical protein
MFMRAKAGIFIIISLLFLVGTVAAAGPFTITITSSKTYLTAGYTDNQAVINVNVKNSTTNVNVSGAAVTFSVADPSLGTYQNTGFVLTDLSGNANNTFISTTKSGITNISVTATYLNTTSTQTLLNGIKVDHDNAHTATFDYPPESAVGTNITFNISFADRWGNPIDQIINPGKLHTINLHVTGPNPYDCIFVGYGPDILGKQLDIHGNVSVKVQLTSGAGPNVVTMDSFEDIPVETNYITAVSTEPFSIKQVFTPDSPAEIPADGTTKFTILYTLFDKFGNPANQQWVWVNTSVAGEEQQFKTDNVGQIAITYGPRTTIGVINITATAVANNTVTIRHSVEFTSTAATTMVVTANPETMASRDVNPSITSAITATVTDIMGNPVENENVTFSLGTVGYPGGPYNVTSSPSLSSYGTITTDQNGDAMVQFIPGSFTTNTNAVNYSATATGNCTVTATWVSSVTGNSTSKNILVTWKNYPYLSVTTSVSPQTVAVNDTVDVTVAFKGDGWALQPSPLDVVLVMDRSGSMGDAMGSHSKLYYAQAAATTFVAQMNQSRDRIGLVSYAGYTSGTGTSIDIAPTSTYTSVNTKINNLNANGATETREALKQSVDLLKAYPNSNPKAIQSLILMTDGNFNWKGSPIAMGKAQDSSYNSYSTNAIETTNFLWYSGLGSTQCPGSGYTNCQSSNENMSIYAKNNNIRIYTIGFSANANDFDPQAIAAMQVMANATGGFYSYAPDGATLSQIYTKIAGDLKNDAGVNTSMLADFQNVNVTGVSVPGAQVYDYVYNNTASTKITWQDGVTNVTNQSAQWAANHQLNFNIGTIKVGQTWQATFRLKVKQSGIIDLFGSNSLVTFNNGTSTLTLPHTYLTVVPSLNATGFQLQQIDVTSSCPAQVPNSAIIPLTWNVTYTGGPTDISEVVSYIDTFGAHVPFYYGGYHVNGNSTITRSAQFDMRTVPPGTYSIQVSTSTADNTASTSPSCGNYTYSTKGVTFIRLN